MRGNRHLINQKKLDHAAMLVSAFVGTMLTVAAIIVLLTSKFSLI